MLTFSSTHFSSVPSDTSDNTDTTADTTTNNYELPSRAWNQLEETIAVLNSTPAGANGQKLDSSLSALTGRVMNVRIQSGENWEAASQLWEFVRETCHVGMFVQLRNVSLRRDKTESIGTYNISIQ